MSSVPHAPPLQAAPRRFTREDVVRAGRSASPWDFIPLGIAAVRVVPQDSEIHFLLAAAYAKLGLRTAASEQVGLLSREVQQDANVRALAGVIHGLPEDRVQPAELAHTLDVNIAALGSRAPTPLCKARPEWLARAERRDWFRASTGDIVWRTRGDAFTWERFEPQRGQVAAIQLPHDASPTAAAYPMWYALDGMDPPWLLERLWHSTAYRYDGYAPYLIISQCDALQALDGLSQMNLTGPLGDPRLRLFVGSQASAQVLSFFESHARAGHRVACVAISLPTTAVRVEPSVQSLANAAAATTAGLEDAERKTLLAHARSRPIWARRFSSAGPDDPLRVLIPTSLYTTFVRHSASDLADAFRAAGCNVRLLAEPDPHTLLEPLASLRACSDFAPDLIVLPNFLRSTVAARFPADVPLITWVQDSMPHLFEPDIGRRLTDRDFIAGNLREEMFQSFGYPRAQAMHAPMAASARKFHPGPVSEELRRRHSCEIAYVSHHSEIPEALHRRRVAEAGAIRGVPELLSALLPRILAMVETAGALTPLIADLRTLARRELRRQGLPDAASNLAGLLTTYVHPIADRALRHRTLAWAAEIATRHGWRFHLYGRGWETHPTLARYDRGELDHGDDLRACYQSARAHLHVSLHTAIHQRVFECALSGGLPLSLLQEGDLSQLEFLAALGAARSGAAPACSHLHRRPARGYQTLGFRADVEGAPRRYSEFLRELKLPAPEFVWLNSVHLENLHPAAASGVQGAAASLWDYFPDPAAVMFHDRGSLESTLRRAVEDDAWRAQQANALADLARRTITYDALAARLLSFVTERLNTPASSSPTP